MKKAQRRMGIILMGLGGFLAVFIVLFFYLKIGRVSGFPELLPADKTIIYAEFPNTFSDADPVGNLLDTTFKLNWTKDISPFAGEKSALALLSDTPSSSDTTQKNTLPKNLPYLFIQVHSSTDAFNFLKHYQNKIGALKSYSINGIDAFTTPTISFAFLSGVAVIAPSQENLNKFIETQSGFVGYLSADAHFNRAFASSSNSLFIYAKPGALSRDTYSVISKSVPQMPVILPMINSVGIGAKKEGARFIGSSYGVLDTTLSPRENSPYGATILPMLPDQFSVLIAGSNIAAQIEELTSLTSKLKGYTLAADATKLVSELTSAYLPSLDYVSSVAPLLHGEFGLIMNKNSVLFITDVATIADADKKINSIYEAFGKIVGRFTPKTVADTLPDGDSYQVFVPDPSQVKPFEQMNNGTKISGYTMKDLNLYQAIFNGKWFISNDLELLKKSLSLAHAKDDAASGIPTTGTSMSLRESSYYKNYLQPILKNPQLLGISILPEGVFSFSKQTQGDHMETNFIFDTLTQD